MDKDDRIWILFEKLGNKNWGKTSKNIENDGGKIEMNADECWWQNAAECWWQYNIFFNILNLNQCDF